MRRFLLISVCVVFAKLSAPAIADDSEDCSSDDPDRMIRGCSAVVDSRHAMRQTLAIAYHRRGVAYARQKDYDRAITDYTKAIELEPRNPSAYNDRGIAYTSKGDYGRAIADVTRAVELAAEPPSRPAATAAMPSTSSTTKNAPSASVQTSPGPKASGAEKKAKGNEQPSWATVPSTSRTAKTAPAASIETPTSPKATAPEPEKTKGNQEPSWARQMWQEQPN